LERWSAAFFSKLPKRVAEKHFLLRLNAPQRSLNVKGFGEDHFEQAFREYMDAELPDRDAPTANVVLVSVDSIDELQTAYPNYYGDTDLFVEALREAIR
jgi:hypothetical protein